MLAQCALGFIPLVAIRGGVPDIPISEGEQRLLMMRWKQMRCLRREWAETNICNQQMHIVANPFQPDPTPPDDSVPLGNPRVSAYTTYRPLHFAHNYPPVRRCGILPRFAVE
jgi:hypothetical protein